jgi:hypothetical protein
MWLETLLSTGAISKEQLQDARTLADRDAIGLERALIQLDCLTYAQIAPLKAADNGLPYLAASAPYTEATVPNQCPLCRGSLDWADIRMTQALLCFDFGSGGTYETNCPHCWAWLVVGSSHAGLGQALWHFSPDCHAMRIT